MFYLSRSEQIALFTLVALLLGGAGVLTYARGKRAARAGADQPIFLPAPPAQKSDLGAEPAPEESYPPQAVTQASPAPAAPTRVSLNDATQEELESLPGIGRVYAQRIIAYREKKMQEQDSGFQSVDELLNIPGIGAKRFAAVRDLVAP